MTVHIHKTHSQIVLSSDSQDPNLLEVQKVLASGQATVTVLINGAITFAGVIEAHEMSRGPRGIAVNLQAQSTREYAETTDGPREAAKA